VPLGFSPVHPKDPVEEISAMLPLLDSTGAKMLQLEEVIGGQLEAKGHVLAAAVVEHVLMCFQCWDPQVSLELVVQGPIVEIEEATQPGVQDIMKVVATWFEH
jgi:hypothetical protein